MIDAKLLEEFSKRLSHLAIRQMSAGVRDYFRILPSSGRRYLETLQVKVIGAQLLYLDPEDQANLKRLFGARRLFLDTNVLIAYFFEVHPDHDLAVDVISASLALGCNLLVTPETLEEFRGQLNEARRGYAFTRGNALATFLGPDLDHPILRTFFTRKSSNPQLSWEAFISVFENTEDFFFAKGVLVEGEGDRGAPYEERLTEVIEILANHKRDDTASAIEHDASNLIIVDGLRAKYSTDELGCQVWLLTLDRGILRSQRDLFRRFKERGIFLMPTAAHLSVWAARIGRYQTVLTFVYDDYIAYLVRSKLGLIATDTHGIKLDFVELLSKAIVDVDKLLDLPESLVRHVVVSLQENAEARALVESAASESEEDKVWRDLKVDQLIKQIVASAESREREAALAADEQHDKLLSRIEVLQSQLSASVSSLTGLESELAALRDELAVVQKSRDEEIEKLHAELQREVSKSILTRILERIGIRSRTKTQK